MSVWLCNFFFLVQITVVVGKERSNANIEITESDISFIQPVSDQYVKENGQAWFECILNREDVKVKWIRYVYQMFSHST